MKLLMTSKGSMFEKNCLTIFERKEPLIPSDMCASLKVANSTIGCHLSTPKQLAFRSSNFGFWL